MESVTMSRMGPLAVFSAGPRSANSGGIYEASTYIFESSSGFYTDNDPSIPGTASGVDQEIRIVVVMEVQAECTFSEAFRNSCLTRPPILSAHASTE